MPDAQAAKNLFAPPSEEELKAVSAKGDLFAPPSAEELKMAGGVRKESPGETYLGQTGNMATLGYLPQLQAATKPAIYGLLNKLPDSIKEAIGIPAGAHVEPGSYVESRDKNIERMQKGEEENPNAALAGKVTGAVGSAIATPLPKLGFLGKGVLGAGARGAAYGSVLGAASNPGDTKGVVDPLQTDERLSNAGHGAMVGGITGSSAALAQKGAQALANSPAATKAYGALKALKGGGAMLKDFRSLMGKDAAEETGQFMLDQGIIKAGDKVEDVAEKADVFNQKAGKQLQNLYLEAQKGISSANPQQIEAINAAGFNPVRDKDQLLLTAKEALGKNTRGRQALGQLSEYLDTLAEEHGNQTLDPRTANEVKSAMDEAINYSRNPMTKEPATEQAYYAARKFLSEKINSHIDAIAENVGTPQTADALKAANRDYGLSKQVMTMAKDRVARENANRMFGLTDTIAGSAGGALGGYLAHQAGGNDRQSAEAALALGLLSAGGNKLARTYGPGVQASFANKLSPLLQVTARPAGLIGQQLANPEIASRVLSESGAIGRFNGMAAPQPGEMDHVSSTPAQYPVRKKAK